MLKIEHSEVLGWEHAVRGMRNPLNSWDKSDSGLCKGGDDGIGCSNCASQDCQHSFDGEYKIGKADYNLMTTLRNAGTDHRKFMRMIVVYLDITAPLYWWKEFDTYKVGTVANSCSTMHKIRAKEFTIDDFSHDHLENVNALAALQTLIDCLEANRKMFLALDGEYAKAAWWNMIQLLPTSYNQKRTVMLNYEVLANIYKSRCNHKLDEWRVLCGWIQALPHSELITGKRKEDMDAMPVR